jgi:hypothetical protein
MSPAVVMTRRGQATGQTSFRSASPDEQQHSLGQTILIQLPYLISSLSAADAPVNPIKPVAGIAGLPMVRCGTDIL